MKKNIFTFAVMFAIIAVIAVGSFGVTANASESRELKDIVGATNSGGYYSFDPQKSSVYDGSKTIYDMGSRVVKLWLSIDNMSVCYPYNTDWASYDCKNCVDILKTSYFQEVLAMDFSTVIFETHPFDKTQNDVTVNYADGLTEAEKTRTSEEMYQIAKYLMLQYVGRDIQFVLQNWEGDNMLGDRFWCYDEETDRYYNTSAVAGVATVNEKTEEADAYIRTVIHGLTDWFRARQDGVDRAMNDYYGLTKIRVRNALEINFTSLEGDAPWPPQSSPILLKTVVPYTNCDLYSYSCWSTSNMATANSLSARLAKYQTAIGEEYNDGYFDEKGETQARRALAYDGQKTRIMLGEFGGSEKLQGADNGSPSASTPLTYETARRQREVVQIQTEQALQFGCEYVVFWEVYCNVPINPNVNPSAGDQGTNDDMEGAWLVRADGTYTEVYKYLSGLLGENVYSPELQDGQYTLSGASGGFEITATTQQVGLSNLSGQKGDFEAKVKVFAKENAADDWQQIATDAVWTYSADGQSHLVFVNKDEVPSELRIFKIESSDCEIGSSTFYKTDKAPKVKMSIMADFEGETKAVTDIVVGSGVKLQLSPTFTNDATAAKVTYSTSNRYVASVDANGEVTGRTSGTVTITITATGGTLPTDMQTKIYVTVATRGSEILYDSFEGVKTISFADDETKNPNEKLPNFGYHVFSNGATQKFYETNNIQFFTYDLQARPELKPLISGDNGLGDAAMAYILDWTQSYGYIVYECADDIGGYSVGVSCYGLGALDRCEVQVSKDGITWTSVSSYVESAGPMALSYWNMRVANRQVIPSGMKYIKIQIKYIDANRWNPQLYDVRLYGESSVDEQYVDAEKPSITVGGTYQATAAKGDKISLYSATYSDNFATVDELETTCRVYYVFNGVENEVTIVDNSFTIGAYGIYKVVYTATDLAGNTQKAESIIEVSEQEAEKGCFGIINIGAGLAVLTAAAFIIKKKGR